MSQPNYSISAQVAGHIIRKVEIDQEYDRPVTVAQGTAATWSTLIAGTPMGIITNTGLARPCAKTTAAGNQAAVTVLAVNESANFYVGDTVEVIDAATGVQLTSQIISGVDKVAGGGFHITFPVAIALVTDGDLVRLDPAGPQAGAETCLGLLASDCGTWNADLGYTGAYQDQPAVLVTHGIVYNANVVGGNALIRADLPMVRFDT